MTEIDTAAEREAANELIESGEATGQDFADVVPELLDAYDRLRAENQRLKLAALTADRESMGLEAENQRLRDALRAADRLMRTATTDPRKSVNAANAADVYSGGNVTLAAWYPQYYSDRITFDDCWRLQNQRAAVESTGGGDDT